MDIENKTNKQKSWLPGDKGEERGIWRLGLTCTLLYIRQGTNKNLLYRTGNFTEYSVMAYMVKESKIECIYVYV